MANEIIGYVDCPHCGAEVALKGSKKGKCYYNCSNCGQFFARTASADSALRAKARQDKKEGGKTDVEGDKKPISEGGEHGAGRGEKKSGDDWNW